MSTNLDAFVFEPFRKCFLNSALVLFFNYAGRSREDLESALSHARII